MLVPVGEFAVIPRREAGRARRACRVPRRGRAHARRPARVVEVRFPVIALEAEPDGDGEVPRSPVSQHLAPGG